MKLEPGTSPNLRVNQMRYCLSQLPWSYDNTKHWQDTVNSTLLHQQTNRAHSTTQLNFLSSNSHKEEPVLKTEQRQTADSLITHSREEEQTGCRSVDLWISVSHFLTVQSSSDNRNEIPAAKYCDHKRIREVLRRDFLYRSYLNSITNASLLFHVLLLWNRTHVPTNRETWAVPDSYQLAMRNNERNNDWQIDSYVI
jgi:hypothetical protein